VLKHLEGSLRGVNVKRSQAANILGADHDGGHLPEFWDKIRAYGHDAIEAFTLAAVILSHEKLIRLFKRASKGGFRGSFRREDLTNKEYTNLVYAMASLRLCPSVRGSREIKYDLYRLIYNLQPAHDLVRQLIASKLRRCGWRDPTVYPHAGYRSLLAECQALRLNRVFAMEWEQFKAWLHGDLPMERPDGRDGPRSKPGLPRRPR